MSLGREQHNVTVSEDDVFGVLQRFGYRRIHVPYSIGNIEFDFGFPMDAGKGHHELILVVSVKRVDLSELVWNVQNIARALDVAGSSRSITLVLIGDIGLNEVATHRLHSVARVLKVGSSLTDSSSIERELAPILPLQLELSAATDTEAPLRQIEKYAQQRRDAAQLKNLVAKSRLDAARVENDLLTWIEKAFKDTEPHEQ